MVIVVLVIIYSLGPHPRAGQPQGLPHPDPLLEVGMTGTFVAQDLILFFVFFEVVLLPMYFMIGVWGGEQRQYASLKFFLYTLFGSALMLLGVPRACSSKTGRRARFSIAYLAEHAQHGIAHTTQLWIFAGMFIGFAIKVPMFPFHTWLPDAHTQAPTVGLGDPGRHPAEAGHLRLHPHRHPDPARRGPELGAVDRRARRDRHHLRRARAASPRPT